MPPFSPQELSAYLDEALDAADMARIEQAVRQEPELAKRLAAILRRRDAGVHGVGEIWRKSGASCPTRQELGNYLLGILPTDQAAFIATHLNQTGCRPCQANVEDMRRRQQELESAATARRTRYFQSSAGYLESRE